MFDKTRQKQWYVVCTADVAVIMFRTSGPSAVRPTSRLMSQTTTFPVRIISLFRIIFKNRFSGETLRSPTAVQDRVRPPLHTPFRPKRRSRLTQSERATVAAWTHRRKQASHLNASHAHDSLSSALFFRFPPFRVRSKNPAPWPT